MSMSFKNIILNQFGLALIIVLVLTPVIFAQEEIAAAPKGDRDALWRIGFWEVLQQTFSDDDSHPFYQMTGTDRFRGGNGFFGPTFVDPGNSGLLPNVYYKNEDGHAGQDGTFTKLFSNIPLLNGLPTFSLEFIHRANAVVTIGPDSSLFAIEG